MKDKIVTKWQLSSTGELEASTEYAYSWFEIKTEKTQEKDESDKERDT